jgi:hypothetical protein
MGLKINTTKTKVMVISKNNVQTIIISDSMRINQVHTHRYLGCLINDKMDCKFEIKARTELLISAFINLKPFFVVTKLKTSKFAIIPLLCLVCTLVRLQDIDIKK